MALATLVKEKINWGWLTGQKFSLLYSWCEEWQHVGRHGAAEGDESSVS